MKFNILVDLVLINQNVLIHVKYVLIIHDFDRSLTKDCLPSNFGLLQIIIVYSTIVHVSHVFLIRTACLKNLQIVLIRI